MNAEMKRLEAQGMKRIAIAAQLGVSQSAVTEHLGKLPYKPRHTPNVPPPEPAWVVEARRMAAEGMTHKRIAAKLGRHISTVQRSLSPETRDLWLLRKRAAEAKKVGR